MDSMMTTSWIDGTDIITTETNENITIFENVSEPAPWIPPKFNIPRDPVTTETWLVPLMLGLVTFIGVVGNSVVIYAVLKNGKMHTVTNFYIVNLAATDIAFLTFVVPFSASLYASQYGTWVWGRGMCKLVNYMQLVSAQATCLTLTAMSVDRYQAIVHPLKSLRTRTTRAASMISICIWSYSLSVSVPTMIYYDTVSFGPFTFCFESWPRHLAHILHPGYVIYMFIVIYAIPVMVISCCYANMLRTLYMQVVPGGAVSGETQERQARQRRKITFMVLTVVIVFTFCWFPFHVVNLWQRVGNTFPISQTGVNIKIFSRVLAYSNSCLNPFVYAFMGENFRKYLRKAFPCCYSNKVGPDLSSGEGRSVIRERTVGGTLHINVPP